MGYTRNAYKVFVGKLIRKRPHRRNRRIILKWILKEVRCEGME
jgi:hypothetical protein